MYRADVVVAGGRVIDPANGTDALLDVVIGAGRIVALEAPGTRPPRGAAIIDAAEAIVTPGLIDLHGHWFAGSPYGIDPRFSLRGGATTAVDAGSCGHGNVAAFEALALGDRTVRLLAFLHVASVGLASTVVGELEDIRYARPRETAGAIRRSGGTLVGVKVRIGRAAAGANLVEALERGLEAAELAGRPLMVDIHDGADTDAVLALMRPGDILTHCFIGGDPSIVREGRLRSAALDAKARGVRFDIGHGCGSFDWGVARAALAAGFAPDTVSTDLHRFSAEWPVVDLPTTMTKLLHLGTPLADVVAMATLHPATSLGRPDLGRLQPASVADVAVLDLDRRGTPLSDSGGMTETAVVALRARSVVRAGRVITPSRLRPKLRPLVESDELADCRIPVRV